MEINVDKLVKVYEKNEIKGTNKKATISELIDKYMDYFEYQIKSRGKEYYENGNVKSVIKSDNTFYAKVLGSVMYDIEINIDLEDEHIDYECDCPYEWPCKHIYAVLLAIKNKEYKEIKLKPVIEKKSEKIEKVLELIPAEEIKQYLLSGVGKDFVHFDEKQFEKYFSNYMPSQSYEYYYNNLYNKAILEGNIDRVLEEYMDNIKTLLNNKQYNEVFHILKAIIEASNDTKKLDDWQKLIELFPLIAMNLRIVYRKCDLGTKKEFTKWKNSLQKNNYYESIYLEDVILEIK